METSMAERMASIMDMRAMSVARLLTLPPQVRGHGGIDPLEHVAGRGPAARVHRAVALRLPLGADHLVKYLGLCLLVALLAPHAPDDEVVLEADDRVPQRPGVGVVFGTIGRVIVGGKVRRDPGVDK